MLTLFSFFFSFLTKKKGDDTIQTENDRDLSRRKGGVSLRNAGKLKISFTVFLSIGLLLLLFSCGGSPVSPAEETREDPVFNVYEGDGLTKYDGREFVFFTERDGYDVDFIDTDGEASGRLADAIRARNGLVEEKLSVKVRIEDTASLVFKARNETLAGETEFDAILARGTWLSALAKEGVLLDLAKLDRLSLGSSYWDANANRQLMTGSSLYFTNGALNIRSTPYMIYYNDALLAAKELPSPRKLMERNEWTLDNFLTLVRSFAPEEGADLSFEETPRSIQLSHGDMPAFLYGCGIRMTGTEGGVLKATLSGEKTDSVFSRLKDLYADRAHAFCVSCSSVDVHAMESKYVYMRTLFAKNLYLFCVCPSDAADFREMTAPFGVAPMPKFDASQENYASLYPREEVLIALPASTENTDLSADVLREMNLASQQLVLPAWKSEILSRKNGVNESSMDALQIVIDSTCYDLAVLYDFGGIYSEILLVDPARDKLASSYLERAAVIDAQIEDFSARFR